MTQVTAGDTVFEKFTHYMEKNTKGVEVSLERKSAFVKFIFGNIDA